jgi:hypothetical protein
MSRQYVPIEFRGLAREFRRQVEISDMAHIKAVKNIASQLQDRLTRKARLRDDMVTDIARAVQAINHPFRLRIHIDRPKRGHLRITEFVIGSSMDREADWDEWEKTTAILRVTLTTEGGLDIKTDPIATISGHAIARYYERTRTRDQTKLLSDLAVVIDAKEADHVATPSGVWLGPITHAHEGERRLLIRTVRTYLDRDQIDTRSWKAARPVAAAA